MKIDKLKKTWVRGETVTPTSGGQIQLNPVSLKTDDDKIIIQKVVDKYNLGFDDASLYFYLEYTLKGNTFNTSHRPTYRRALILQQLGLCTVKKSKEKYDNSHNITSIKIEL